MLALVPPDFADPQADYRAVRAMMAPFHGHPVPAHVTVSESVLGGVRCAWYDDDRAPRRERVVFHCHGGGLVSCPLDDYHFYGAMLAEQFEARVVMADYRLAPEHPFPAAHEDCLAAYRGLLSGGVAPRSGGCQRRLLRRAARARHAHRRPRRGPRHAGLLRVDLGLVRPLRRPSRSAAPGPIPSSPPSGCATAAGSTPPAAWRSTTPGCRPPTPTCQVCHRSTCRWVSSTRCVRASWSWRRPHWRQGSPSPWSRGPAWCTAGRAW